MKSKGKQMFKHMTPGTEHSFIFATPAPAAVGDIPLTGQFIRVDGAVAHIFQLNERHVSRDKTSVALVCVYLGPVDVL
jgi:hypothetical protein